MHEKYRIGLRALLLGTAALTGLQYDFARAAEEEAFGSVSEIVILGTLADRDILENLRGVSRTEIDPSEIETRQIRIVSDLLRDVPGIAVSRTGPAGGSTQVRIRGAEGNHALVLIDGMEASEPFQGEFDFATLLADDIAEIEVLRGQQSALYGSDAIGGVIHYTTPSGRDYPGFRARTEGGSFGTYAGAARLGGYEGGFDYVVGATYYKTDGVVVARQGNDEVGSKSVGAYAKFAFAPAENFFLTAVARYSGLDTDTSPQDFGFPPDPDTFGYAIDGENTDDADAYYALVKGELDLLNGDWTHALTLQGVWADRTSATAGAPSFTTEGARRKIAYVTSYYFGMNAAENSITFSLDHENQSFRNLPLPGAAPLPLNDERSLKNTGFVAEYNLNLSEAFGLSAAYRRDWNSGFDDSNTYRLGASYLLDNGLKFHAAYGTGFKAPTNFELFGFDPGTFVGNPNLKPELSRGWEIGAQKEIGQTARIGATYFNNTLENEIFTIFTPSFETTIVNLTMDSKQRGIEFFASADLDNGISLDASYTYLDAEESGAEEVRRAPHIASGTVSWHSMDERFGAFLSVRYNGEQKDSNFTLTGPPLVTLPGYALVSAGGDWRLNKNLQVFGRVENLFDADYEDVYTFGTAGRAFYVGIRGNI